MLGGTEIGIGAFYHPDRVPRAMLTVSTSLAAVDAALDEVADTLSSAVDLDVLFAAARRPTVAG